MAFHLISSNKVELLTDQLVSWLNATPLRSPFTPEVILVPSMPMKRWLGLQLAESAGINCNTEFPLPAAWLWDLVSSSLDKTPKLDPLARDQATWKIFDLLPDYLEKPQFEALEQYLANDLRGIKRWQLSERIADVFDRYQYYRPDTIRTWSHGGGDDWQAHLWRALQKKVGNKHHRVALIDAFMTQLREGKSAHLPERISIFAVSSLPPLLLQVIQAVAQYTDVYLFYLTPTNSYWADLKSGKEMARQRLENPNDVVYLDTGHGLLASWGRQGQVFQDLLLSDDSLQALAFECYHQEWPDTLLGNLQSDMFHIQMSEHNDIESDKSLQVHVCHSALRETQVLHDNLLKQLDADPTLKPEDILVMIPAISSYAPYIEAVFGKDESRPFIPWNLSDTSVADEHPVIGSFLQLLHLPESRFSISEILSFLDVPEICARFHLDADKLARIRLILEQLHVRWGIDPDHKMEFKLPSTIENSWKQAELRLMAGYAMGDDSPLWQGIAPYAVDNADAAILAEFWSLFESLNRWRKLLKAEPERSAAQWQALIADMLDSLFFDASDKAGRLQLIRDALADLAKYAFDSSLSLDLVRHWLGSELSERETPGRYFSGGVSFCGMRPMRSLPFRVICLLGMQDAAFPNRERPLEFDQMVNQWHPGDPGKGEMDRYLMLETLLCVRETLHISYTGRSVRDNSECQPSVLIRELLDQLEQQYGEGVLERIIHVHPMQAFAPDNYHRHHAYDAYWCMLANAIGRAREEKAQTSWPEHCLEVEQNNTDAIELRRLIQFCKHPVKYFINNTLRIYLREQDEMSDDEPFTLDGLENWQLKARLLADSLQQKETTLEQIKAEAMLPHGGFADQVMASQHQAIIPMLEQLEPYHGVQKSPQMIELSYPVSSQGEVLLSGQIQQYYPGKGLLHVTASSLGSKNIMPLWLEHLALCATAKLAELESSILICRGELVMLNHLPQQEALDALGLYVETFFQGLKSPLPLFPKTSWAFVNKATPAKLTSLWSGNSFQGIGGDKDDPYIQLLMRSVTTSPIDEPAFARWAESQYQPLLQARRES